MTVLVTPHSPRRLLGRLIDGLHRLAESPLGAVLGGMIYGGWATFAHWMYGLSWALRVGAVHFALTTGLTFMGVQLMNRLFGLAAHPLGGALVAALGSLVTTYGLLIGVHSLIGTQQILLTLAPGLIPTLAFTLGYSWLLFRRGRESHPQSARDATRSAPASIAQLCADQRSLLQQALAVIDGCGNDAHWYASSRVGAHLRHVFDHVAALIEAGGSGWVNYENRQRDTAAEHDPQLARRRLLELDQGLLELSRHRDRALRVGLCCGDQGQHGIGVSHSSLARELQFVVSHSIHHFAIIRSSVLQRGISLDPAFGKAPGTLHHEREQAGTRGGEGGGSGR